VSEIVKRMERRGVLTRLRDRRDRRRTLVWLTPLGQGLLERETSVLSEERLTRALKQMNAAARRALVRALRLLIEAADGDRVAARPGKGEKTHASRTRL
jgi:DNA-binding MarR family transcriptional regulator